MTTETTGHRTHEETLDTAVRAARALVVLTVAEAGLVLGYLALTEGGVLSVRYLAYPFVWTNAALLAVAYAPIPIPRPLIRDEGRLRFRDWWTLGALAVATGYFVVLCWAGGLLSMGHGSGLGTLGVHPTIPGWGPIVTLSGGFVHLTLVPFKLVGYLGLAVLAYAAFARASRGLLGGALGLVTCVSCTGSILGALFAGLGGSSVAVSAVMAHSYDLSTAVFLLAIGALWVGLRR